MNKNLIILFLIALSLGSCRYLNPSQMLKAPKDYVYDTLPKVKELQTRLNPNDQITMMLLTNDGFKLLDMVGEDRINANMLATSITYKVEFDGLVNFPIIGRVMLGGLTIREAEAFIEDEFSKYYVKPFVLMKITNRKVMVFPGTDGQAKVVSLIDDNTNLLQVIAQSGGITQTGRAYNIKVIRGQFGDPKVFQFNFRKIEGLKNADFMMQSNDIVYVTPSPQVARRLAIEISPYLTLLTTFLLVLNFFKK